MQKKKKLKLVKVGSQYINPEYVVRIYKSQAKESYIIDLVNKQSLAIDTKNNKIKMKDVLKVLDVQVIDIFGGENAKK